MLINFKDALSQKTWLKKELMQSLNDECFINLPEGQDWWDVKLVVNGIDVEPVWFNSIMTKLEEHIEAEAKKMFKEHLEEIQDKLNEKTKKLLDDIQDIHLELILKRTKNCKKC